MTSSVKLNMVRRRISIEFTLKTLSNKMKQDFDLIVFDWDGTLIDSTGMIASSLQSACDDLGFPVPCDTAARYIIGLGLSDAMRHVLPALPAAEYPRLAERYRHHFLAHESKLTLFRGAEVLLKRLFEQGYLLAVATGKTRVGLDRGLRKTGVGGWFGATRCADECFSKPHPAMLKELMEHFAVEPRRTLMVGDTTHDLQMAANAGCSSVAIAGGAHPRNELLALEPLACFDAVADLGPWLSTGN